MYIIATEDLEYYIPWSGRNGGHTAQDVARNGGGGNVPRLFTSESSAKIALGMWLSGPFDPEYDECGWYSVQRTDPNRKAIWGNRLAVRKVELCIPSN